MDTEVAMSRGGGGGASGLIFSRIGDEAAARSKMHSHGGGGRC